MASVAYAIASMDFVENQVTEEMYGDRAATHCVLIDQRIVTCISDDAVKIERLEGRWNISTLCQTGYAKIIKGTGEIRKTSYVFFPESLEMYMYVF